MKAYVLQDWVTVRGASGVTQIIQNEANYAALDQFQDVVMWLQVPEVTTGSGTITMNLETAPLKDESLFTAMTNLNVGVSTGSLTPTIKSNILGQNPATPLSRWVRWRITTSGTSAAWDMTFRILLVANQQIGT
jgi:hypothetical protein